MDVPSRLERARGVLPVKDEHILLHRRVLCAGKIKLDARGQVVAPVHALAVELVLALERDVEVAHLVPQVRADPLVGVDPEAVDDVSILAAGRAPSSC